MTLSGGTMPLNALVVAPRLGVAERVCRVLRGCQFCHFETRTVYDLTDAAAVATRQPFHAVVVAVERPPDEMLLLASAMRRPGSASRNAGLVVCCDAFAVEELTLSPVSGVNRVVFLGDIEDTLPGTLERLLAVAPRARAALPSRIEVSGPGFSRKFFCQTVNLSTTGMLLRVPHSLRPGTVLAFELFVPGTPSPVRGKAKVVRLARPDREPFPAVGITFSQVAADDMARLESHIQKLVA
jgi:hypothetical protein